MKTTKEMIEVMQAFKDGKKIEYNIDIGESWVQIHVPAWNWDAFDYRIAEEPKPPVYKPYGPDDALWLLGRKTKRKGKVKRELCLITNSDDDSVLVNTVGVFSFERLFENFLDVTDDPNGVPFGRVVEANR